MINNAIKKVIERNDLSEQEMIGVMDQIMAGNATDVQIASFITALRMKGETIEEITGAARVMHRNAVKIPVLIKDDLVDIVGTGGDAANTFNISTAAAIVACGAGVRIAKHGNRAVSSSCGSADVIEHLGINIDISPESVGTCIDEIGIGFLFARKLHRAMKYAAPVRNELGVRTIFNILGPLTNPADAPTQIVGVFDEKLTEVIANVLNHLGKKRALVVHGKDGLDEISLGAETVVSELCEKTVTTYAISPEMVGFSPAPCARIAGGTPEHNTRIIFDMLNGKKGPHRDIVCLNAGAALVASNKAETLQDGVSIAADAIDSGNALQKLGMLKDMTNKLS